MAKRKIAIPESIDEKIATAEAELADLVAQAQTVGTRLIPMPSP